LGQEENYKPPSRRVFAARLFASAPRLFASVARFFAQGRK
jgi:hypothetical protein